MRVISGEARGIKLDTLEGDATRPTIDRVKEAVFSSIQFIIGGATVLDLFAGSGQMGIEALSRGAKNAVFVDENRSAVDIVIKNLKTTKQFTKTKVLNMSAQQFLLATADMFDIVFLDPPYNQGIIPEILPSLEPKLSQGAVVFCETEPECQLPQTVQTLEKAKTYKYGKVLVTKYIKQ